MSSTNVTNVFDVLSPQEQKAVAAVDEKTRQFLSERQSGQGSRLQSSEEMLRMMQDSDRQLEEVANRAGSLTPDELAEVRRKIMTATLTTVRESADEERKDIAEALLAVNVILERIDKSFAALGAEHPDDIALVKKAEDKLASLERDLIVAESKTNFLYIRDRAIQKLKPQIEEAKSRVESAKAESLSNARHRLLNSKIDELLHEYLSRTDQVVDVAKRELVAGTEKLQLVTAQKVKAFAAKEFAIGALNECKAKLAEVEARLSEEEEKLQYITKGSTEYAQQETLIAETRSQLEQVRVAHNNAFILASSKTEYAEELRLNEVSLQRLTGNLQGLITHVTSAREERAVTFQARLAAQQLVSSQEALVNSDQFGAALDLNNRKAVVTAAAAADNAIVQLMSEMPGRMVTLESLAANAAEKRAQTKKLIGDMLESFENKYGIDVYSTSESSFSTQN